MHQELSRSKLGTASVEGVGIPWDVLAPTPHARFEREHFGQGGAFVQTDVEPSVIPVLRNKTTAIRLGATVWDGLTGNVALPPRNGPRCSRTAATVSAQTETGVTVPSTQTLDQILMSPKRATLPSNTRANWFCNPRLPVETGYAPTLPHKSASNWITFILNGARRGQRANWNFEH